MRILSHLVSINKLTHGQEIDRWRFPTLKPSKYWLPNTHTWFNASLFSSYLCLRRCSHTSDLHIWAIPEYIYLYLNKHPISKYIFLLTFSCTYFMIKWHWSSSKLCQRKRELLLYQQKARYRQYKMMLILFHAWTYNGIFIDVWYFGFCLECISWEMSKIIFVDMCVI